MISNLEKNFASAVVYSLNSEPLVEEFLLRIDGYLSNKFEHFEIIFVDDCSTDGSVATALRIARGLERATVTVINMSYTQGKETAMAAGVDMTIGDFVFEFESLSIDYPNEILDAVYDVCLEGNDIVAASPRGPQRLANRVFFSILNRSHGSQTKIATERFRILSRRAINRIGMVSGKVVYRKAVYYSCGLKTVSIPYDPCKVGQTTQPRSTAEEASLAIDSLLYFTNLGFKVTAGLSLSMVLFSASGLLYAVGVYIYRKHVVEGWLTTMLFLAFGFLGVFSILTIMMKYLSLILATTHKKQPYIFESVVKANRN